MSVNLDAFDCAENEAVAVVVPVDAATASGVNKVGIAVVEVCNFSLKSESR